MRLWTRFLRYVKTLDVSLAPTSPYKQLTLPHTPSHHSNPFWLRQWMQKCVKPIRGCDWFSRCKRYVFTTSDVETSHSVLRFLFLTYLETNTMINVSGYMVAQAASSWLTNEIPRFFFFFFFFGGGAYRSVVLTWSVARLGRQKSWSRLAMCSCDSNFRNAKVDNLLHTMHTRGMHALCSTAIGGLCTVLYCREMKGSKFTCVRVHTH